MNLNPKYTQNTCECCFAKLEGLRVQSSEFMVQDALKHKPLAPPNRPSFGVSGGVVSESESRPIRTTTPAMNLKLQV